jgi:hypothetical protein
MIIRKAKYRKVKKLVTERVSEDVYGCDQCKKEFKDDENRLEITVFFSNAKLKKQREGGDTDCYQFCSWNCVGKFLPTIKCDYFISLPFLHFDKQTEGTMAKDFFKLLTLNSSKNEPRIKSVQARKRA